MVPDIVSVLLVVGALYAVISVPVGMFNTQLYKLSRNTKCSGLERFFAYLPLRNITYARNIAYAGSPAYTWVLRFLAGLVLLRVIAMGLAQNFPLLLLISSFGMMLAIVVYILLYIINAVDFCRMFCCGALVTICCVVCAPLGYYLLSLKVPGYFKRVEDEVSGRFGTSDES